MKYYWLMLTTVLLLVAQSIIIRVQKLKGVQYKRTFSTNTCFEGEQIHLVETIRNDRIFPIPWIRLESMMSTNLKFDTKKNLDIQSGDLFQNHKSLFSMMPYTEITRRHRVTCLKRGCYPLNTVSLSYGDLIGLYSNTETIQMNEELVVYPKPAPLEEAGFSFDSLQGDISVRRWLNDDPFTIRGVRDYRQGDAMRSISWNATARVGRLQVFEKDFTANPSLFVCINVETHENMWKHVTDPERVEKGIRYAAAWLQYAVDNGWDVGLGCNGYLSNDSHKKWIRTPMDSGVKHLYFLFEILARLEIKRSIPIDRFLEEEAKKIERKTEYVMITSFVSDSMHKWMEDLRSQGHGVTLVSLQEEEQDERQVEKQSCL